MPKKDFKPEKYIAQETISHFYDIDDDDDDDFNDDDYDDDFDDDDFDE